MKPKTSLHCFLLLTGSLLLAISSASAQSTWTNTTTGTQQWNTATNWDTNPTVPNGTGVTANLSLNLGVTQTVNLASGVTLGSLTYGDSTTAFFTQAITGSAITFNNSGAGATLTQAGATAVAPGSIANTIVLNDNLTIVNNGTTAGANTALTLSGVISGTGGISLNAGGGGQIYTNKNNTFSGGVTFNHSSTGWVAGTVGDSFGTGTITFNGAGSVITSTPGGGAYLLTTSNRNVWNSGWTVSGLWNNNGNVTLGANASVSRATHLGLGGNIVETGAARTLTLTGAGTTVYNGTNTYSGGTTVSGGSLAFLKTASMPSTGNVSFATTAILGIGLGGDGWTSTGTGAGTLAGIFQGTNVGVGAGSATLSYTTAVGLNLIVTGSHSFGVLENLGSGATAFTKSGFGALTMTGDNTYTGATTVQGGGALVLDYGSSDNSKFASAAALTLGGTLNPGTGTVGGGSITLKGGTFTEVVSATTLNQGQMTIARDGGTTAKLRLNIITRTTGGTISFADATIADTDTNNFGTSGANGIIGGWATVGNDWAVSANTGAANTAITALASYAPFVNTVGDAAVNYLLNGTDTLAGTVLAGTLKITDSGASQSLTLGANNLTITSTSATALGGIMYAGGTTGSYTITGGGAGRLGTSVANSELIFAVQSGTLTVNAIFAGNNTITKAGAGTLVIGATNTGNGGYFINEGVVRLNNAAASGGGNQFGLLDNYLQNGAALELIGGFSFTSGERFLISGTGISNGGAFRSISGANTWQGQVEIATGGARINNDSAGLFTLNQGITTNGGGDVTIGGTGNTTVTNSTNTAHGLYAIRGGGGLIKDGAGTLTLSGANNHIGNTTVNLGTLILADNASLRFYLGNAPGVNNSLTGTGTVTLAGDFVIDTSTADSLSSGTWTLENVSTLTGAYGSTFTVIGFTDAGSNTWTKLVGGKTYTFDETTGIITLSSGDVTPPTLTSIADNQSGGPVAINTLITYTVTFGEDIDASTVSAADFDNHGSSAITIGTIAETTPTSGIFTVQVTPTTAGTLNLRIPIGAVVKDVAGNNLVVPVSDDTTINVQTPYEVWAGGAAFDADANGDGVKNGLAFLLGATDKNVSALNKLPIVTQSVGNLVMTFSMLNAASRGSATLNLQQSSDLGISDVWTTVAVTDANSGPTSGVTFVVSGTSPLNVTATISSTEAASGKLFGRLNATQP